MGPGLESTSPDNKRVFPDSLYKTALNFLTFVKKTAVKKVAFENTWNAIVYNNQCYAKLLRWEMTESHFLYFFLHFNEPISFAIVILDGLYLWVWESSIVKAVENACIVEESQVSCTHKKHLLHQYKMY